MTASLFRVDHREDAYICPADSPVAMASAMFVRPMQILGSGVRSAQNGIWLDEEPPIDVCGECIIRTATRSGWSCSPPCCSRA